MKEIPEFKNESAERDFWATADSTESVDWPSAKPRKLIHLKPSVKTMAELKLRADLSPPY